ncbi:MAG: hypothetical protein NC924_10445 [Candidatus Omnitrophica bacterium]|nr:hypothetical protein [Candidatus Omnitrophota bacterium]
MLCGIYCIGVTALIIGMSIFFLQRAAKFLQTLPRRLFHYTCVAIGVLAGTGFIITTLIMPVFIGSCALCAGLIIVSVYHAYVRLKPSPVNSRATATPAEDAAPKQKNQPVSRNSDSESSGAPKSSICNTFKNAKVIEFPSIDRNVHRIQMAI